MLIKRIVLTVLVLWAAAWTYGVLRGEQWGAETEQSIRILGHEVSVGVSVRVGRVTVPDPPASLLTDAKPADPPSRVGS